MLYSHTKPKYYPLKTPIQGKYQIITSNFKTLIIKSSHFKHQDNNLKIIQIQYVYVCVCSTIKNIFLFI